MTTVSIAEGKKGFSRLIQDAAEKHEEVVVTKRGKPVAVILPYDEYRHSRRTKGYRKIMAIREDFLKTGLSANEVYEESRRQLERKK